jgi:hypothetical protein
MYGEEVLFPDLLPILLHAAMAKHIETYDDDDEEENKEKKKKVALESVRAMRCI